MKSVGGKEYVYVKHGRTWHYVGPLDRVGVGELLSKSTTALPLRGAVEEGSSGERVGAQPKPAREVVAAVLGVALVAVGAAVAVLAVLGSLVLHHLALTGIRVSASVLVRTSIPANETGTVYAIIPLRDPVSVNITMRGGRFKVLAAPLSSLPQPLNVSRHLGPGAALCTIDAEKIPDLLPRLSGNYAGYSATLEPEQALLVWPHALFVKPAWVEVSVVSGGAVERGRFAGSEGVALAAAVALALAPWLLAAAALIAGGYLLSKWSRSG